LVIEGDEGLVQGMALQPTNVSTFFFSPLPRWISRFWM